MAQAALGDGGSVAIGTGETELLTLNTSLPGGEILVIACVQVDNTAAAVKTIAAGDLKLKRGAAVLAQNQLLHRIRNHDELNDTCSLYLVYRDTSAPDSPSYTVTAKADATGVNGEAKILAIQGLSGGFVDGSAVSIGTSDTTLASVAPGLASGRNIVVAAVQLDNTAAGNRTFAAGNLKLKDGAGNVLCSNQYQITLAFSTTMRSEFVLLVFLDADAGASESYSVTAQFSVAGELQGEAKILVFHATEDAVYVDTGSVVIDMTETEITELASSFSEGSDVAVIAAVSLYNAYAAGGGPVTANPVRQQQNDSATGEVSNQYTVYLPSGANSGRYKSLGLISKYDDVPASAAYQVKATKASGTVELDGETKMVVVVLSVPAAVTTGLMMTSQII